MHMPFSGLINAFLNELQRWEDGLVYFLNYQSKKDVALC